MYGYAWVWSHPVRVRGLKALVTKCEIKNAEVAPRAGAWIERFTPIQMDMRGYVAPRAGAWIESPKIVADIFIEERRTPCGCVD